MVTPSDFCGFAPRQPMDMPWVPKEGEHWVHEGWRDKLRFMVRNRDWQRKVRSKLSTCSKVYVAAHSAGGAVAELFTACAHAAPQPGSPGYESDYKYIGW